MSSALISSEQALNDYFTALLDEETAEFESTLKPEPGVGDGSCHPVCAK